MGQAPSPTQAGSVSEYDVGDLVRLRATFVSTDMVTPADPLVVVFQTKNVQGSVACYMFGESGASVTRVPTGGYYRDVTIDLTGPLHYRAMGTGGVQAASGWKLVSRQSEFFL